MYKISEVLNLKQTNPNEQISVFIDAEYVIQSIRVIKGKPKNSIVPINNICWDKFILDLIDGRTAKEIIYYSSELNKDENPDTYKKQKEYLLNVQKQVPNLSVRLGKMQKVKVKISGTWVENTEYKGQSDLHTWVQKGIDVKMSLDLILKAVKNEYETAILVAGDSDFEEVIKEIKFFGKKVELVTFDRFDVGVVGSLSKVADEHKQITYEDGNGLYWKTQFKRT
ncbi:MAG: hypothetical protein Fur0028_04610 [Bacteroidales bacterium]